MYYTIGQRRGLGIGGQKEDDGSRWFVIEKDLVNNILYVAHGAEDKLFSKGLLMNSCNFMPGTPDKKTFECTAKFRYRQPDQEVLVTVKQDGGLHIDFNEKQRAVTEGQYAVLYDGINCLGGGVIDSAEY